MVVVFDKTISVQFHVVLNYVYIWMKFQFTHSLVVMLRGGLVGLIGTNVRLWFVRRIYTKGYANHLRRSNFETPAITAISYRWNALRKGYVKNK